MNICERNCVPASERPTASNTTRHPAPFYKHCNARDVIAAELMLSILELSSVLRIMYLICPVLLCAYCCMCQASAVLCQIKIVAPLQ